MDLEAYTATHRPDWQRLRTLSRQRHLDAAESDELLRLYSLASDHLSAVQAQDPDGPVASGLSITIASARRRITSGSAASSSMLVRFFTYDLPAAFYRIRWLTLALGLAFLTISFSYGAWFYHNPELFSMVLEDSQTQQYVDQDFVNYYSENPAAEFAGMVWTNNAWIAAQEVAFGITGFFVPVVLWSNAQSIGISGAVMGIHGEFGTFFNYILPHGYMELTAIFIAGAAGLQIFWAWVAPGRRTRLDSVASAGRSLITVAIGLVLVLLVSGVVEAFVTPSPLPDVVRHGIGLLVLTAYWVYALVQGRRAVQAGYTGDLASVDAGTQRLSA